jgi:hypothetical protein
MAVAFSARVLAIIGVRERRLVARTAGLIRVVAGDGRE